MKEKHDRRIDRRGGRKAPPAAGGKALSRLFFFNAQRDLGLNLDLIEDLVVPGATVSEFSLPKGMTKARANRLLLTRKRKRKISASAQSYAAAIAEAAKSLAKAKSPGRSKSAAKTRSRATLSVPGLPVAGGWRSIGPAEVPDGQTYGSNRVSVSGRVSAIAIDPVDHGHILVGSAAGGIWQTKNAHTDTPTWQPCTDSMPSLAIGAIAFDPRNRQRVYAGSGEGNFFASLGVGLYRSNDGGTTWTVTGGSPDFVGTGFYDLVVDPADSSIVYAATTRGLYVSTDRGAVFNLARLGRCWDISVHSAGGSVEVLAAFEDGLFVSTDNANSFTRVLDLPGWWDGAWTRLAVDRVADFPDVAYVFGCNGYGAYLWRREGTTWSRIDFPPFNLTQAWYDWYVAAPPDSPVEVYIGAIDTQRGDRGPSGTWNFTNITTQGGDSIHPDQHCLVFEPGTLRVIYAGTDGGVFRAAFGGAGWQSVNKGLAIAEIEYMAADPSTSSWLMAGTQDNGTLRYTGTARWDHIADGDGGDCGVNEQDPNIVYHSFVHGALERSPDRGSSWVRLRAPVSGTLMYPPVEVAGRTVAVAGSSLALSRSGGDLTTVVQFGLPAGEAVSAMRAIDANTLVLGTNRGKMLRVVWAGTAWSWTGLGSPAAKYISCIAVDPSNPQRLWLTSTQLTGRGGRVYRSDDGGVTWIDCSSRLPGIPINSVVVDPANYRRVWVAADVGVYETLDLGLHWAPMSTGLPNAMAVDLVFHRQDRRLFCGTRNRGVWVIDVP